MQAQLSSEGSVMLLTIQLLGEHLEAASPFLSAV